MRISDWSSDVCSSDLGRSDWLASAAFYTVPQYVSDMVTLIARLRPASLAWVGTSMGGLIGLALAGAAVYARMARATQPNAGTWPAERDIHLARMVLNDVGPRLEPAADRKSTRLNSSHYCA